MSKNIQEISFYAYVIKNYERLLLSVLPFYFYTVTTKINE